MMPEHLTWIGGTLFHQWHPFRGPLIGIATALVLALLGRILRIQLLAVAAGGAGVVAGWYAITGALWVMPPPVTMDVLTGIAAAALIVGLVAVRLGPASGTTAGLLAAGVLAGWWLSGAPRHPAAVHAGWPIALGVGVATVLFIRVVATGESQPLRLALAGLTMAASLHVVGVQSDWVQLALVPGVAALAMLVSPPMPGIGVLPVALDIVAVGSMAVLTLGRAPRLGFGVVDLAVLSPLLALWLSPHVAARVRFAGRAAPLVASVLAGAIAVAIVWGGRRLLGR
jgi:hypothetical protein